MENVPGFFVIKDNIKMITLFSGIPGSGKSYKMVAELSRCKDKYFVCHNIDGLQEGYLGIYGINFLDYCVEQKMQVEEFLSKDYQIEYAKAVHEKYDRPILVIVDEAHEWFSTHSRALKMWLSYHRHIDEDIWLVAHRSTNLPSIYRSFIEVEYRAKSGSILGVPGFFVYNRILGGQRAGYKYERKKQAIFDLYTSIQVDNEKKRKTPMMIPAMIVVVLFLLIGFFMLPGKMFHKTVPVASAADLSVGSKNSAAPVGSGNNKISATISNVVADIRPDEKYAYAGEMNGLVILEDRITGEQQPLSRIPGRFKVVEIGRADYCIVFSGRGEIFTIYNSRRNIPVEKPARQMSAGFFAGSDSPKVVAN